MPAHKVGIPLREALQVGPLSQAVVLAGEAGLDRIVSTVNVMETDDAFRFLNGNELLITALFAVKDDPQAQLRWLDELAQRGCAGLILCYIGRYFQGGLDALIRRANELSFPLLTIPDSQVVYSDIMTAVLTELLHRQTTRLEYALSVHNRLTQEALRGASPETLITSLSELLRSTVVMTDSTFEVLASSCYDEKGQTLVDYLVQNGCLHLRQGTRPSSHRSNLLDGMRDIQQKWNSEQGCMFDAAVHPIQVEETLVGYLVGLKCGEMITKVEEYALQVGITVIALEHMKSKRIQETEQRLQRDFIDDLLVWSIRSPEVIRDRAKALGLNLEHKHTIIVISIDPNNQSPNGVDSRSHDTERFQEEIYNAIKRLLAREAEGSIVLSKGRRLLILTGNNNDSLSSVSIKEQAVDLAERIVQEAQVYLTAIPDDAAHREAQVTLSLGIATGNYNYANLHAGYADALQALEIGQRLFGPGHIMHIDDTQLYSILDFVSGRQEARQMIDDILGPIKSYDAINGTDLLGTLEMVCIANEPGTEIAKRLFIHRNTLHYRQTRIKELLGFDPFSGQGLLRMEIALMLNRLIETSI